MYSKWIDYYEWNSSKEKRKKHANSSFSNPSPLFIVISYKHINKIIVFIQIDLFSHLSLPTVDLTFVCSTLDQSTWNLSQTNKHSLFCIQSDDPGPVDIPGPVWKSVFMHINTLRVVIILRRMFVDKIGRYLGDYLENYDIFINNNSNMHSNSMEFYPLQFSSSFFDKM